jgi:hypothetical protein
MHTMSRLGRCRQVVLKQEATTEYTAPDPDVDHVKAPPTFAL